MSAAIDQREHDILEAPGLAALLRDGSAQEHRDAEDSSFVQDLLEGRVSDAGYLAYLSRLAVVYDALESAAATLAGDPVAAAVIDPALDRRATLATDLAFWQERAGAPVADLATVVARTLAESPAAAAYAERIRASVAWGGLFVAHHYTRYLGDLSGGQVIGRMLTRHYGLPADQGVAFFDFPEIPKPKPYKDAYRARLDALPLDAEEKQRMVDEVRVVFGLNQALFEELGSVTR